MLVQRLCESFSRWFRGPKAQDAAAFVAWVHESAVKLDPVHWPDANVEQLSAALDPLLEGKRIVYLGEEDHWVHEKNPYRLLLLRYLISRGWRTIGEELGWSDGLRINRFMSTGDEIQLDRIATFGYRGDLRKDRDDSPTGILMNGSQQYPVAAFAAEQKHFYRALRDYSLSAGQPLTYFGLDIDALAGGGYQDLIELLAPVQDQPVIAEIINLLQRCPGETIQAEVARLGRVLANIEAHVSTLRSLLGDAHCGALRKWALTLRDSLEFVRVANPAKDYKTLSKAMAAREKVLLRHVEFVLEQMGPDGKLVLMGHNRHLAKDFGSIKNPGGAPPGGDQVPALGTSLNRLLPGQVFSIWSLYDHGLSSQPYASLTSQYHSTPGSLNAMLAEVDSVFLLPTASHDPRARLLNQELDVVGLYNQVFRTAIAKQADAVFFLSEVSPLQE